MSKADDDDTEIVIVSDTVRQRRSRTPISVSSESNVVVMPDLLPKTFKLAESCSLFSDASVDETQSREVSTRDEDEPCSMVEVKERDLSMRMSIRTIELEDARVDTINIFESCTGFEPQQVETVNIIDASSDTDTATSTPVTKRRSLKSVESTGGSMDELKTELKRELDTISYFDADDEPSEEFCIKKQRISFDAQKAVNGKERDVLRDSEVAEEQALRMLKLRPTLKELWMEERNSFYDNEPDPENDEEALVFSDDEEIPRYSIEMDSDSDAVAALNLTKTFIFSLTSLTLWTWPNSNILFLFSQSRIATPNNNKRDLKDKDASFSADDSFTSPLLTSSPFTYKSVTPLEQRVDQFEKTARYMVKKLDQTLQQIQACDDDGANVIEHMKLSIAPDAALILSQGDTLILETHGKNSNLTQRLVQTQKELRDKYKDVQNANTSNNINMLSKNHNLDPENQYSPKEKVFVDKKFPVDLLRSSSTSSIKLEDLVAKVFKRVNDLISKPVDFSSDDDLTKRILDIGVSMRENVFPLRFPVWKILLWWDVEMMFEGKCLRRFINKFKLMIIGRSSQKMLSIENKV